MEDKSRAPGFPIHLTRIFRHVSIQCCHSSSHEECWDCNPDGSIFHVGWGQLDDEFWFVAPEVIVDHGDAPILLRFATYNDPADIIVSMPANPDYVPYSFSMDANSAVSLDLTDSLSWYENKPFNQVLDKGIHITSTSNISAYYEVNRFNNPDIFALKGDNALGTSFRLAYQNFVSNVYSNSPSGFDVVATEPNTTVTIVPTHKT